MIVFLLNKVFTKNAVKIQVNGRLTGLVRATKTESHFRTVEYNANRRGMLINEDKTRMLCISSARSYLPEAYFHSSDGTRIKSSASLKVLGFTFTGEPNVRAHIKLLQQKFKARIWALRHLRRNGFQQKDLVLVYKSMVRPVAEYCSSVFYSMMTAADSLEIERIQMQALKSIFGWKLSYRDLLVQSGVDRLDARRETAFLELAKKLSESPRYSHWFPRRPVRRMGLRKNPVFRLYPATTERYMKSPLNRMRRMLNELFGE